MDPNLFESADYEYVDIPLYDQLIPLVTPISIRNTQKMWISGQRKNEGRLRDTTEAMQPSTERIAGKVGEP